MERAGHDEPAEVSSEAKMAKKKAVKSVKKSPQKSAAKAEAVKQVIKIEKRGEKPAKVTVRKEIFGEAPEEKVFFLADGRRLKNLMELIDAFENMGDEVFRHHVNEAKNDFSKWINDVFKDEELADDMKKVENKVQAEIKMLKHIVKELTSAT